jgi:hypothetical protein
VTTLEHFGSEAIGLGLQLFTDGGDGVCFGIQAVVGGQQFTFFGEEQENQAHHDRERRFI